MSEQLTSHDLYSPQDTTTPKMCTDIEQLASCGHDGIPFRKECAEATNRGTPCIITDEATNILSENCSDCITSLSSVEAFRSTRNEAQLFRKELDRILRQTSGRERFDALRRFDGLMNTFDRLLLDEEVQRNEAVTRLEVVTEPGEEVEQRVDGAGVKERNRRANDWEREAVGAEKVANGI